VVIDLEAERRPGLRPQAPPEAGPPGALGPPDHDHAGDEAWPRRG